MIVPALVLVCSLIGLVGVACLIAGECFIGVFFLVVTGVLEIGLIYMAWRTNLGGRHE